MGLVDEHQDATARGDWHAAFEACRQILNRKRSRRLIAEWIAHCCEALRHSGKAHLLPSYFDGLSVYGKREELNKINLQE